MTTYYYARAGEIIPGAQTLWVPMPEQPFGACNRAVEGDNGIWRFYHGNGVFSSAFACPYLPGSVLAVREDWRLDDADERLALKEYEGGMNPDWIVYPDPVHRAACFIDWRRADTMPDWAIRHRFQVASVTAKRLSEAGIHDAVSAGMTRDFPVSDLHKHLTTLHGSADWYWVLTKETP